jgi:4-hydroxybenzoate polyprenyltransferase
MMTFGRLRTYGQLVAFSHTIFALPFAAVGVVVALREPHVPLTPLRVLALLICMVSARTCAMAFNRWADHRIDAANPRTASRPIPSGAMRPGEALGLAVGAGGVFWASAATLGRWPLVLAPAVLGVLCGYSYAKRLTWAAHLWLGVALSLAPGGAYVACGAEPTPGLLALMLGVVFWLFGFDILYSLQDESFDRAAGLHSVPARFGTVRALRWSAWAHVLTVAAWAASAVLLRRGPLYAAGVAVVAAVLVYEHRLVGKGDLTKIDKAFFDANAWVSVLFLLFTLADDWMLRSAVAPDPS